MSNAIADQELTLRTRKVLQRNNITTIEKLTECTEYQLLGFKNFGQTSLQELKFFLKRLGLSLSSEEEIDVPSKPTICPDCKGTKRYIGLLVVEPCRTCQ